MDSIKKFEIESMNFCYYFVKNYQLLWLVLLVGLFLLFKDEGNG